MTIQQGEAIKSILASQEPAPRVERYQPTGPGRCCEQAKPARCVCVASWKCPVHGSWCWGSHD